MIEPNHYYRLRKRARALRLASTLILGAIVFACVVVFSRALGVPGIFLRIVFWIIVAIIVFSAVRSRCFTYAFGEKSMIVRCGVLFSGHDIIPYHHIESVYATRSAIGRLFNLCVLHIHVPRAEGLRTRGDHGEIALLCARRGSDEIVFLVTVDDARDIVCLIKKRMKRSC